MVKSEEGRTFPFNRVARGRGVCVSVPGNLYICMLHLPLYWCSSTALYFNSNVDSDGQHMQTTDTMKNKEISLMEKFWGVSRLPRLELYMYSRCI